MSRLSEIAGLFLNLGFTAFGGPAAHIGIMYSEVVLKRQWLTDAEFLDLLGASFVFVAISNPLIPRIRNSVWAGVCWME